MRSETKSGGESGKLDPYGSGYSNDRPPRPHPGHLHRTHHQRGLVGGTHCGLVGAAWLSVAFVAADLTSNSGVPTATPGDK
jgi:hypothetical protein